MSDPAAADTYECSSSSSLELDFIFPLEGDDLPEDHHLREGRDHCCAPFTNPLEWYANTDDVPLSRTEKKIWMEFQKFDKKIPGLGAIYLHGFEKEKMAIKIDNPVVSLIGNFAIAAFNEAIEKYVKKGEHKNLRDYKFMECAYIKMRGTEYYFYLTIEAIEEGILGVYETKVRLEWDDGKKKRVKRIQMTDPGDWFDPMEDKYNGMKPRSKSASCMGYDYRTQWGFEGP